MNHCGFLGIGILAAMFLLLGGTNHSAQGCASHVEAQARLPKHVRMLFGEVLPINEGSPFPGDTLRILYSRFRHRPLPTQQEYGRTAIALALDPSVDLLTCTDITGVVRMKYNPHNKQYVLIARDKILAAGYIRSSAAYPSPDELFLIIAGEIQNRSFQVGSPLGTSGFVSPETRTRHWRKHGDEIALNPSEEKYEELAVRFANSESTTALSVRALDGSRIKMDMVSLEYVRVGREEESGILTYFRKRHLESISLLLNVLELQYREDPPPLLGSPLLPQWGQKHDVPAGSER